MTINIILGSCSITNNTPEIELQGKPSESDSPEIHPSTPIINNKTPLPPANILRFQKFKLSDSAILDMTKASGKLVVLGEQIKTLHFVPKIYLETIQNIPPEFGCLSTSPDGRWLAYCQLSSDSPTGQWLIVQSPNGQEVYNAPMDMNAIYFDSYLWLDNQNLIFPLVESNRRPQAYSMLVINPFVGEIFYLNSDYPSLSLPLGGNRMSLGYSDLVYDPSLDLVIFPSWTEDSYIVLWNRQSSSILSKIKGDVGKYPRWEPGAGYFAVPLRVSVDNENEIEEWFLITREGEVEQVTHFGEYFTNSEIGSASNWSSDGQKLAFWLDVSPSECPGLNLAILDLVTTMVENTCIPGSADHALPPIWSLDNQYIIVYNVSNDPSQAIIINVSRSSYYDVTSIAGGSRPIGWLVTP